MTSRPQVFVNLKEIPEHQTHTLFLQQSSGFIEYSFNKLSAAIPEFREVGMNRRKLF